LPILSKEDEIYPGDLLQNESLLADEQRRWYCLYTISRREKDLVRKLIAQRIGCYLPVVPKRYRSPAGRLRTSFVPLFNNYVFLFANDNERYFCMTTNCISRMQEVTDGPQLVDDLRAIQTAIAEGIPLTPEARVQPGQRVRVRRGPFEGYEGQVIRREGKTRLLLSIRFLEQGVSMEVDEAVLELI
jgi:transcription antitermination factor NusG